MKEVEQVGKLVEDVPRAFEYPRDPKDEPYINLAIAAQAVYLASRDRDLLDLMNDLTFTSQFPGIRVLDPAAWLREIAAEQALESGPGS
ncbi:MAG: putative toxin-antitoxin system toxin component, PIN family [Isosphaeraceae bacterium]